MATIAGVVRRGGAALLMGAPLLGAVGCERRLPGVDECQRLSYRLHGLKPPEPGEPAPDLPKGYQLSLADQTRECFGLPYDRELIACLERGAVRLSIPAPPPPGRSPRDVRDAVKEQLLPCFEALARRRGVDVEDR